MFSTMLFRFFFFTSHSAMPYDDWMDSFFSFGFAVTMKLLPLLFSILSSRRETLVVMAMVVLMLMMLMTTCRGR
jgi:sensor histidine kinase YesM